MRPYLNATQPLSRSEMPSAAVPIDRSGASLDAESEYHNAEEYSDAFGVEWERAKHVPLYAGFRNYAAHDGDREDYRTIFEEAYRWVRNAKASFIPIASREASEAVETELNVPDAPDGHDPLWF